MTMTLTKPAPPMPKLVAEPFLMGERVAAGMRAVV